MSCSDLARPTDQIHITQCKIKHACWSCITRGNKQVLLKICIVPATLHCTALVVLQSLKFVHEPPHRTLEGRIRMQLPKCSLTCCFYLHSAVWGITHVKLTSKKLNDRVCLRLRSAQQPHEHPLTARNVRQTVPAHTDVYTVHGLAAALVALVGTTTPSTGALNSPKLHSEEYSQSTIAGEQHHIGAVKSQHKA